MAKRKKVEAVRAWGGEYEDGTLMQKISDRPLTIWSEYPKNVRVVIIRESDYRRLLKAAQKARNAKA